MKRLIATWLCALACGFTLAIPTAMAQGDEDPPVDQTATEEETTTEGETEGEVSSEEGTPEEESEEGAEERVEDKQPVPSYRPPGVSLRSKGGGALPAKPGAGEVGPIMPLNPDEPGFFPDPEVFSDPSTLPGPIPPPPTVFSQANPNTKFTEVTADHIVQDRVTELTTMDGNCVVVYEDTTIRSQHGTINDKDEIAHFWGDGGVETDALEGRLNADDLTMEYNDEVKHLIAVGQVDGLIYKKTAPKPLPPKPTRKDKLRAAFEDRDTTFKGDELQYWWGTKEFHLWVKETGRAELVQDIRKGYARDIHYVKTPEELVTMSGTVELWQKDGQWLYEHDIIENKDSKLLRALMAVPSTVTCDDLSHNETTKLTKLDGKVDWKQDDKEAKADTVTIDDSPKPWEDPATTGIKVIHSDTSVDEFPPEAVAQGAVTFAPPAPEEGEDVVPTNTEFGGKILIAEGNVWAHQDNGEWLFLHQVIEEDENEKVKEDARKTGDGWADHVVYHLDTEDFEAEGNVHGEQPHQRARADTVHYLKSADRLEMEGDVRARRRDKDEVLADRAILFLTSDIFQAWGNVESQLIINTDEQKPSDDEGGRTLLPIPGGTLHPEATPEPAEGAGTGEEGTTTDEGAGDDSGEETAGTDEAGGEETGDESGTETDDGSTEGDSGTDDDSDDS